KQFAAGSGDRGRVEIVANYADCRAVMQWALVEEGDVLLGSAIAASLGWYWSERGQWREGRFWLERALACGSDEFEPALRARIHLGLAVALYVEAEFSAMVSEARRAEEAYAVLHDVTGLASARNLAAIGAQHAGRMEEAHDLLQSVLVASREVKNVRMEAVALGNLAELYADWKADYAGSEQLYERAARIHRDLANSFPLGVTLGDWSATAAYQGDFERAEALAVDALNTFRGIGEEMRVIEQLIRIGHYRIWAGRFRDARAPLAEMMELLRGSDNVLYSVRAAEALAEFAVACGDAMRAVTLFAFSQEQRRQKMLARPAPVQTRCESTIASAKAILGDDAFAALWEDGRPLAVQSAIDIAESLLRD
ncbi:MAG TPA: hypothetical protein VK760_06465, partial [Candidatus Acidoferrales bacterium]|nr:hypothetical protein [Candidatus Acidoferrales bacterium]